MFQVRGIKYIFLFHMFTLLQVMSYRHYEDLIPALREQFVVLKGSITEIFPQNLTPEQYTSQLLEFVKRRINEEVDECLYG
jgi:hypothetical protein